MLNTINKKTINVNPRLFSGKTIVLSLAGAFLLSLSGCGSGKTDVAVDENIPAGMMALDLSAQGLPVAVNVPDSTMGPLEVTANSQGGVDIKVGKSFQMTIMEGEGNMDMKKNDITHDDIRKFVKYLVEEPNALVWEWQIEGMEPDFHFYALVKAGDKSFEARNVEGEVFSETAVTQMLESAKSIRPKTPAKVES